MDAYRIIHRLGLEPLPLEGGYFRETWRSGMFLGPGVLPPEYTGARSAGTAIYFLLSPDTFSAMHRLPGDEVYHFYLGDPVELLLLRPDGVTEVATLGQDLEVGMDVQRVVPGGCWQGSRLREGGGFALLGTTMAPGFDPDDFQLGVPEELVATYPERADLIRALCREPGGPARG